MGDGKENAPNKIFCCGSGYRRFISLLLSSALALDVRPAGPNGLVCHWVWHRALITLSGPSATVIPKLSSHLLYLLCRRGRGGSSCGCWLCCQSFFLLFVSLLRGKAGFLLFSDWRPSSRVHTCVVWSLASWNLSFCSPVCFPFLLFPYHTSVVRLLHCLVRIYLWSMQIHLCCLGLSKHKKAMHNSLAWVSSTEASLSPCFQSLRCLF